MDSSLKIIETELLQLVRDLCHIPAPSGSEDKRAEFCKKWLLDAGAQGVYIDKAKNVVYPMNGDTKNLTVFMAHTDTVFPDTEPLPFSEDTEKMYSPGIGDDTVCVAILMMTVKYLLQNKLKPSKNLLFVLNSCEEGLGNLKGTRQLFSDYAGRISSLYTYDGMLNKVVSKSIGSHRYEVTVKTKGGHSFSDFGRLNAISCISELITRIYGINVPERGITTYNVGTISGGTSVNTIAQNATMLCEYRSDSEESLLAMEKEFMNIFKNTLLPEVSVSVKRIGERPCMKNVDKKALEKMEQMCCIIQNKHSGKAVTIGSGSTDCNIPHSLGIPAVCVGVYEGGGVHTREEWIMKDSVIKGFLVSLDLMMTD